MNDKKYFIKKSIVILLIFIMTTSLLININKQNSETNIKNITSKQTILENLKQDTQKINQKIEELFNIELTEEITKSDTDNDGIIDSFTDPNNILKLEKYITVNNNPSFLISINNDMTKLFLWDTTTDEIKQVQYETGKARTQPETDPETYTVKITIEIEQTDWAYIKVEDALTNFMCSNYPFSVQRCDETTVSKNRIWIEDGTTYLLDTPCEKYYFLFTCEEEDLKFLFDVKLELTKQKIEEGKNVESVVSLKNVGDIGTVNGTLTYNIYKNDDIVWTEIDEISTIFTQVVQKTLPLKNLEPGKYTCQVILNYDTNKTASASEEFTIEGKMSLTFQIAIILAIVVTIIAIYFFYKKKK